MNKPLSYFYWIASLALLTYVVLCAIYVPFTVDEAWTYSEFIKGDFWKVVTYEHPTANNHILNTILAKPFAAIANSELLLRMPNILAYVLYLYSSYRLSNLLFTNQYFRVCLFIALQCNITMLQFFALCRGYGLSIGLMTFSIMQLTDYLKNGYSRRALHFSLCSFVLAMYASFTLLYVVAAVFLIVFAVSFYKNAKTNVKEFVITAIAIPAIYFFMCVALCLWPIMRAINAGEFYWGGDKNFVDDTLFTFLQDMVGYSTADAYRDPMMCCFIALIIVPFIILFVKRKEMKISNFVAPAILFWCMLSINIQFYLFTGKIIMHRTALFLFPLIILSAFSCLPERAKWRKKVPHIIYGVTTGTLLLFMLCRLNLTTIEEWWFDADNKEILRYMNKDGANLGHKIRVLPFVYSGNSLNYYIERDYPGKFEHIENIRAEEVENYLNYDYLYLQKYYRFRQEDSFKVIYDHYCDDRMTLYKRK